jgi:hypothetical protein
MILNKVTEAYIVKPDGSYEPIVKDKTYHLAVDLYSMQMLGAVTDMSKGLLKIVPKDKDGNPITDPYAAAVRIDGKELKAWDAVARYISSFEEGDDGIPVFPEYYSTTQGLKNVDDSMSPAALLSNPNKYSIGITVIAIVLIAIPVAVIVLVVKKVKKKHKARTA